GDEVRIKTDDGSDVTMDVEVNYRLIQDANLIRDKVIPESGVTQAVSTTSSGRGGRRSMSTELVDAYKAKWVRDYARSVVRYVFGELDTKTFYNAAERDGKTRASVSELNRLLNPHGIEVQQVVPDNFEFYSEFEKLIADTKAADEEVDSQKRKADAALEDQKKQETTATARANVEIATITGDLAKAILISEADAARETKAAEAYAYAQKQGADAGLYDAKNMAQSLLVKATAEAEGVRQLAASLSGDGGKNLVKMEYAKVLENAVINGLPYSTDPRIQKLEISGENDAPLKAVGGKR
ncbi:MAG: SPFH domain-containing protein, partial [Planctomycetota bacterium]|nr:SPFH domain-containing protein [Planctomycetota bacterium]